MTLLRGLSLPVLVVLALPAAAQDRDYGIGVVRYLGMNHERARDTIRAEPSVGARPVAILAPGFLCFVAPARCVRTSGRMISFEYEYSGWAILGFSMDSAWVSVTLEPRDTLGPLGWVQLRPDSVTAILWSSLLPTRMLYFPWPDRARFFETPSTDRPVHPRLVRQTNSGRLDLIMRALEARGRWLRVELFSPSPMCQFPRPTVVPDTVWVEFLREDGRPNAFYYPRGC